MATTSERKEVFTIIEKAGAREGDKGWWVRIGTAFVNRDGSLSVKLDALPVNGTMHIRNPLPKEDCGEYRGNDRGAPRDGGRGVPRTDDDADRRGRR